MDWGAYAESCCGRGELKLVFRAKVGSSFCKKQIRDTVLRGSRAYKGRLTPKDPGVPPKEGN